jgi:hypothetical protein
MISRFHKFLVVGSASVLSLPAVVFAQRAVIIVDSPREWRLDRMAVVPDNAALLIKGRASHPDSVREVQVNGKRMQLKKADSPGFLSFETTIPPKEITEFVRIVAFSTRGDSTAVSYRTNAKPVVLAAKPPTTEPVPTIPTQPSTGPVAAPVIHVCSWRPYQKRSIAYGIVGIGGIAVGAGGQKAGYGIAGLAAVVAGVDAFMTSNRTGC